MKDRIRSKDKYVRKGFDSSDKPGGNYLSSLPGGKKRVNPKSEEPNKGLEGQ